MTNIHIICLGKLKESYWQEAEAEYLKRLQPYTKIIFHELREESFDEKTSTSQIKEKEAKKISVELGKIKDKFIIALDEHGKQFSSVDFAKNIQNLTIQSDNLVFIIGGPLGLDESILKLVQQKLSFSLMTFTHQMIRVFLLEQIYRAQMINSGRKYHY